jgi:hypothetical protein
MLCADRGGCLALAPSSGLGAPLLVLGLDRCPAPATISETEERFWLITAATSAALTRLAGDPTPPLLA